MTDSSTIRVAAAPTIFNVILAEGLSALECAMKCNVIVAILIEQHINLLQGFRLDDSITRNASSQLPDTGSSRALLPNKNLSNSHISPASLPQIIMALDETPFCVWNVSQSAINAFKYEETAHILSVQVSQMKKGQCKDPDIAKDTRDDQVLASSPPITTTAPNCPDFGMVMIEILYPLTSKLGALAAICNRSVLYNILEDKKIVGPMISPAADKYSVTLSSDIARLTLQGPSFNATLLKINAIIDAFLKYRDDQFRVGSWKARIDNPFLTCPDQSVQMNSKFTDTSMNNGKAHFQNNGNQFWVNGEYLVAPDVKRCTTVVFRRWWNPRSIVIKVEHFGSLYFEKVALLNAMSLASSLAEPLRLKYKPRWFAGREINE